MFIVLESFPSHAVFEEETKRSSKESNTQDIDIPDYFWVVGGTDSCICERYEFGTLNALLYKGKPILGIIDQPDTKGRWIAVTGRKTTKNCEEVSAGACQDLVRSCMDVKSRHYNDDAEFACNRMVRNAGLGHRWHDESCACGFLASGFVDLVDYGLDFYDFLAMILAVEGADGVIITDWEGYELC